MTPVRFGIVGYGFGARYFHAPLLVAAPECEVVGVMTSSADRQALVAREIPGAPTVTSLQALVEAGAEAVAISTPAETHSAVTDQALQLGLAVVCDKPFAMDPAAARRSVALAEERALMLSPYQNRRWDLDFRTVQKLVADGAFGTVTRFELRFERFAPERGPGRSGGGTLLDFGSHLADQALLLLGPAASVYAEFRIRESRPGRRRLHRSHPCKRRSFAALGKLEPICARPSLPCHRHDRDVRARPRRHPGEPASRR